MVYSNYLNINPYPQISKYFLLEIDKFPEIMKELTISNSPINKFPKNPKLVNDITITGCYLENFENSPIFLGNGDFANNKIKSFYGIQNTIRGSLSLKNNLLENFDYAPEIIDNFFDLENNKIINFKNFPKKCGEIYFKNNPFENFISMYENNYNTTTKSLFCNSKTLNNLSGIEKFDITEEIRLDLDNQIKDLTPLFLIDKITNIEIFFIIKEKDLSSIINDFIKRYNIVLSLLPTEREIILKKDLKMEINNLLK